MLWSSCYNAIFALFSLIKVVQIFFPELQVVQKFAPGKNLAFLGPLKGPKKLVLVARGNVTDGGPPSVSQLGLPYS